MVQIKRYSLKLVQESNARYDVNVKITSAKEILNIATQVFDLTSSPEEKLIVCYLDTKNRITGTQLISHGTLNASLVHPREVFKGAILANAHSIILVHNHPSGDVEPSNADKQITEILKKASAILQIDILDHVIVSNLETPGRFFSFRESCLL